MTGHGGRCCDWCDDKKLERGRSSNFRLLLDKLVVRIQLQFEPESFTTKPCPRAHERVAASRPCSPRFESPPELGGRPLGDGLPVVARHDQVRSEPRVTTHRAQPFLCALPSLLSPTVEVCALSSLIAAMSSTRLTLLDQTLVVCLQLVLTL